MKLVSMKRTKTEKKESMEPYSMAQVDDYGYNTRLSLGRDECAKLGIDAESPLLRPGTEITLQAKGYIKSGNIEFGDKDGDSPRIEIQLTDIGVEEDPKSRKSKAAEEHFEKISKKTS